VVAYRGARVADLRGLPRHFIAGMVAEPAVGPLGERHGRLAASAAALGSVGSIFWDDGACGSLPADMSDFGVGVGSSGDREGGGFGIIDYGSAVSRELGGWGDVVGGPGYCDATPASGG